MSLATRSKPASSAERATCQLCGKDIALLPNGKLRYHSCQPIERAEPQTQEGTTPMTTVAAPAPDAETPIQADEVAAEDESQEAPEEITVTAETQVEDAKPGKAPKAPKAPKEPKAQAERKVPESVERARAERAALVERANPIIKVTGTGENGKGVAHMYDAEADRTLCGAVVPANEEARTGQGWFDTVEVGKQVASEPTGCDTCSARMAKLSGGGPIRKRTARKSGEAKVGRTISKQTKGKVTLHLVNDLATPLVRTLCGAIVGNEPEGWSEVGKNTDSDCPTCLSRKAKLEKVA